MGKLRSILLIVGIVIIVLAVILLIAGFYFYNFYVFKTVRVCVGESVDSEISCSVTQDCIDMMEIGEVDIYLENAPNFIRENFQKVFDEAIYCNKTCFIKNIRGVNIETQELEMLDGCEKEEIEFVVEIRGKEGLEIWKWMKDRG